MSKWFSYLVISVLSVLVLGITVGWGWTIGHYNQQNRQLCDRFEELKQEEDQLVEIACRTNGSLTLIRVVRYDVHHESGLGFEKTGWTQDGYEYTPAGEKPWHKEY